MEFLRSEGTSFDVLCFQEVIDTPTDIVEHERTRVNLLTEMRAALPDHAPCHAPILTQGFAFPFTEDRSTEENDLPIAYGQVTFVRKSLAETRFETVFVCGAHNVYEEGKHPRLVLIAHLELPSGPLSIFNFHGTNGDGKMDTPQRLTAAARLRDAIDVTSQPGRRIVVGDFNLNPDTESLRIIRGELVDLVATHGIATTRSALYEKRGQFPFADYALVSPELNVRSFRVPDTEASDHLPLILEIE